MEDLIVGVGIALICVTIGYIMGWVAGHGIVSRSSTKNSAVTSGGMDQAKTPHE